MRALLALVTSAVCLVGCGGDSTAPATPEAEGAWSGPVTFSSGATGTLSFALVETSGTVTGTGNLVAPSQSISLTINGTFSRPTVSLTMTSPGFEPINLTATVGETSLSGTMNGSGFLNSAVTIARQ